MTQEERDFEELIEKLTDARGFCFDSEGLGREFYIVDAAIKLIMAPKVNAARRTVEQLARV